MLSRFCTAINSAFILPFVNSASILPSYRFCVRLTLPKCKNTLPFTAPKKPPHTSPLQAKLSSFMPGRPQASPPSDVYKHLQRRLSISTVATHIILFTFTQTPYSIITVHTCRAFRPTHHRTLHRPSAPSRRGA